MKLVEIEELNKYNDEQYVWYACYGSNINYDRFMYYINGDKTGKYSFSCGCTDKSEPTEARKYIFNCPIYFAGESEKWGGGMAFLDYENTGKSYGKIYKIKMSQFKSIFAQEGKSYDAIILIDYIDELPVFTFTAKHRLDDRLNKPSKLYIDTIKEGLLELYEDIDQNEIEEYLETAYNRNKNIKGENIMEKILFATGNATKAKRFSKGLEEKGIEVITLKDIDTQIEVEEDGKDAIENAILKARAYAKVVDIPVFAMDDNLYLENVPEEKQPGMFVRRVNGKRLSDEEMIEHYSNLVKEYGSNGKLTCRWVYGMAVINKGKEYTYTWSKEDFYMVDAPSKKINPGYPLNTISINKKLNKYFTDMTEEDKAMVQEDESDVVEFIANSVKCE